MYSVTALVGGVVFYSIEKETEYQEALANADQLNALKSIGASGGAVGSGALGGLPQECSMADDVQCARAVAGAAIDIFMPKLKSCKQGAPDIEALNWTLAGAFFYAFTIMTTIGYGTFAPATVAGKAATLIFGPIGIAVSGSTVYVLNQCMDQLLVWIISAVCRWFGVTYDPERRATKNFTLLLLSLLYLVLVAAISTAATSRHIGTSIYFSFVTLSTIGLGDFTFEINTSRSMWSVWAQNMLLLPGLCMIGRVLQFGSEFLTRHHDTMWDKLEGMCIPRSRIANLGDGTFAGGLQGGSHATPPTMKKHPNPNSITPVTSEDSHTAEAWSPHDEDRADAAGGS